ncbi:hypothetical protein BGZ76_003620 [Entomortierella beljakovae]|nr:hypothetical protein BGZ76_003620 [Entomortierella beljakovae]
MSTQTPKEKSLFCIIDGNSTPFSVYFKPDDTIDNLKKAIKKEKAIEFAEIDADKLTLWLVNLEIQDDDEESPIQLEALPDAKKLRPITRVSKIFPEVPEDTIHILVQKPAATGVKRERELEVEIAPKYPKYLGATGIADTRIFQTLSTTADEDIAVQTNQQTILPRNLPNFEAWRTMAGTIFADKTPYIKTLENQGSAYRYIYLRPRRFGKSAFLNMLCAYYDIHNASIFDELFGPLYIGKNPTSSKNSLLVLKIDLSMIDVTRTVEWMGSSFNEYINRVVLGFVKKYSRELSYPKTEDVINKENASDSLGKLIILVGREGWSLFVGVDEYDTPANNCAFADRSAPDYSMRPHIGAIEDFFHSNFFNVLRDGCAARSNGEYSVVINKYFLTGVMPAFRSGISPLLAASLISLKRGFHGACGFTEPEVKAIVEHYLGVEGQQSERIVHSLRRLYNGYNFAILNVAEAKRDPLASNLIYNPHLVFHYISNYKSEGFVAKPEESTAVYSSRILSSISDFGEFSVEDLVNLVLTDSVEVNIVTEFGYTELMQVGSERAITWSLLYYHGVLTLGEHGRLCIPNEIIKSDVLKRVEAFVRSKDNISSLMIPATRNLRAGNPDAFASLLQNYLQSRAIKSLGKANESVLQGVVELLLDEPHNRVPELRLIVDSSKTLGNGRLGFVDIFVARSATASDSDQTCIVLELKNATLENLCWGSLNRRPTYEEEQELFNCLLRESEEEILARKYSFFTSWNQRTETTIGSIIDEGLVQLDRYLHVIVAGEFKEGKRHGILDDRVNVEMGLDDLRGYLIMAVGGARIIIRPKKVLWTTCSYMKSIQV